MRFMYAVLIFTAVLSTLFITTANAAPSGYSYMKEHTITGSADGVLSDYPVKFIVNNSRGTDHGQTVFLNGHSQSWPYDVRFVNKDDQVLDYWIESFNDDEAAIWVEIDHMPAGPDSATVSIYYGKPDDPGASSIENTFIFGDEFASFDTSRWQPNDYVVIDNSTIIIPTPGQAFYESNAIVSRGSDFSTGQAMMARLKGNSISAHYNLDFGYLDDSNRVEIRGEYQSRAVQGHAYNNGKESRTADFGTSKAEYHTYEIRRYPEGKRVDYYADGRLRATLATNVYAGNGTIRAGPWVSGSQVRVDWIAVRPFTPDEPAHGTWSNERALNGLFGLGEQELLLIGSVACVFSVVAVLLLGLGAMVVFTLKKKK